MSPARVQPAGAPPLVVVGSIGLDTVETPYGRRAEMLGGSVSYACAAASFFTRVGMVGIVGHDFPQRHRMAFEELGIDLEGLRRAPGRTFRWSGVYARNMDERRTLKTELNVFAGFRPRLPPTYRQAPFLFLANIAPELQLHVLDQMECPRFVMADTMDLWIETERPALDALMARVDLMTLNESEARHLTGHHALPRAARAVLELGPARVLIKKGEHGAILFSRDRIRLMPAYPLESVCDPTGAGDTFAGGLMGRLAGEGSASAAALWRAMLTGNTVASFGVEGFGLERLLTLTRDEIDARVQFFRAMLRA